MAKTQIRGNTQIIDETITNAQISASAAIATSKLADGSLFVKSDGSVAFGADQSLGGFKITNLATPVSDTDAATKAYVDAAANGLDIKGSVKVATTTNITLSGTQTIDGVSLSVGNRVLVKDQSTASQNGIYVVASGSWSRATDADANTEVTPGMFVFVEEGTVNADSGWVLTTDGAITLDSTNLTFVQFSGAGQVVAGAGLTKSGNTLNVVSGNGGIVVNADDITLTLDGSTLSVGGSGLKVNNISGSTLADGKIFIGNGSDAAAAVTPSGDVTISNSGVTTIGSNKVTLGMLATLAANSVIGNSTGSTATPTAVSMLATATASSIAFRNSNANLLANNFISNLTTTATAAGTTTLTVSSSYFQQFTGSTTQTVVLPDATTLTPGHSFLITNRSSGVVTVNANGGGLVQTMAASSQVIVTVVSVGSSAGTWDAAYSITNAGSGGGTVTSVSVVSTNGFAGSVANSTTTPDITISTTVSGILKGNGTAISAASSGADFVANANFIVRETPSGSINGSNVTFTLANTPTTGTEQVYLNGMLQEPGAGNDYTISGDTITYLTAPATGDRLRVSYMK